MMANDDVIELGSSEDETEPKKVKPKRNAMVCIPGNLPRMTPKKKPANMSAGSAVTVKKVVRPYATSIGPAITVKKVSNLNVKNISKTNGKPMSVVLPTTLVSTQQKQAKSTVNPLSLFKKVNNGQAPSTSNVCKLTRPIKINPVSKQLTSLPSSITIKKTKPIPGAAVLPKMVNLPNTMPVRKRPSGLTQTRPLPQKKRKLNPAFVPKEMLTVELDDDEGSVSSTPPWYLPPEAHSEQIEMEEQNNAEPKSIKPDEIIIEDSPVKPVKDKRMYEIGVELPITIEDSPAKGTDNKESEAIASDNDEVIEKDKEPQSRKKLEYTKQSSIEIEIPPMEVDDSVQIVVEISKDKQENKKCVSESKEMSDVEFQESEIKDKECQEPEPAKYNSSENTETIQVPNEFHPVYQDFIDLCFKLENSDDMKKIVEKKIKAYYKQVPKEYTASELFLDLVSSKISLIKASPEKMYLYIKDVVDELNLQRRMTKSQAISDSIAEKKEAESFLYGEESEFDGKRQRQIKKLEKTLKKLHRAIQKLEEQEVDFDDEEDSVYLLTERYKERMVRVHAKFCQLTNTKMPSEPRIVIEARPGQPSGPAKRIEKWINRRVPIGTPLPFPDFHDVLRCVRDANDEDKLGWNEADIMEEARDLFTRCGKKLQRRRQENEWRLAASRISSDITDPAEANETLKKKLDENKQVAKKKETEVFNKFADRQCQLRLEAEEIGDKEAEESPVESEDDEPENTDLGDKERRKERLKRLIQEKSVKKVSADKKDKPIESEETVDSVSVTITDTVKEPLIQKSPKVTEQEDNKNADIDSVNVDASVDDSSMKEKTETIQSISEESDKIGSDIDELHLLQKLHSENEINSSTLESSDNDTPIDISDTLDSGDNKTKTLDDDVISIEDSSYSEEEQLTSDKNYETIENKPMKNQLDKTKHTNMKPLSVENVLAISEEEICEEQENPSSIEKCDTSSVELRKDSHTNATQTTEITMIFEDENSDDSLHNDDFNKFSKSTVALSEVKNSENEGKNLTKLKHNDSSSVVSKKLNTVETKDHGKTLSEQETDEQNTRPSVEISEDSSVESGESKKPLSEESNVNVAEEGNPSSVEFCENSSVASFDNKKISYEEHDNSNENKETLSKDENNEKAEKSPPSVELCDSSSVELCEDYVPTTNKAAKIEDSKTVKELPENVKFVSNSKTYNVIYQDSDMKEIEIAHSSPDDNFDSEQDNLKNKPSDLITISEENESELQDKSSKASVLNEFDATDNRMDVDDSVITDCVRETAAATDEKKDTDIFVNKLASSSCENVKENDTFEQALQALESNL